MIHKIFPFALAALLMLPAMALAVDAPPSAKLSLFGVSLGDSVNQVYKNAIDRGYRCETSLKASGTEISDIEYGRNIFDTHGAFSNAYSQFRSVPNIFIPISEKKFDYIRNNMNAHQRFGDRTLNLITYEARNLPDIHIYVHGKNDDSKVLFVVLKDPTKQQLANLVKKYGEPKKNPNNSNVYWRDGNTIMNYAPSWMNCIYLFNLDSAKEALNAVYDEIDAEANRQEAKRKQQEELLMKERMSKDSEI